MTLWKTPGRKKKSQNQNIQIIKDQKWSNFDLRFLEQHDSFYNPQNQQVLKL